MVSSTSSNTRDSSKPDIIIFGSHDHYIYCVHKTACELLWKTKLKSQVYATPFVFKSERFHLSKQRLGDGESDERKRLAVKDDTTTDDEPTRKFVRLENTAGILAERHSDYSYQRLTKNVKVKGSRSEPIRECNTHLDTANYTTTNNQSSDDKHLQGTVKIDALSSNNDKPKQFIFHDIQEDLFVVAACTSGTVAILNVSNGIVVASYELPGEVFSSPVIDSGQIIIGCRDDFVYCLDIL